MKRALSFLISVLLVGCGGGGGGGGGSPAENASTGVRIVHGSIDAVPLDAYVAGSTAPIVSKARFGFVSFYGPLAEGTASVSMTRSERPSQVVETRSISVAKGDRFTFLLYGDNETFGLGTQLLKDNAGEISGTSAKVRLVDGMTGASVIRASVTGLAEPLTADFGKGSDYATVPAGPLEVVVTRGSDGKIAGRFQFAAEGGHAYSIFALGELDYYVAVQVAKDTE